MIEDSIHVGKYPLEDQHKRFSNSLQVINRSDSDDLKSSDIKIEVRIRGLYIISNYVPIMGCSIFTYVVKNNPRHDEETNV